MDANDVRLEENIKSVDMSEDMIRNALVVAKKALNKYSIEKDIASYIKSEFDRMYGYNWHCIVGKWFGSFVTHESKHYIYF